MATWLNQIRRQQFKPFEAGRERDKLGLAFKYSWRQVDSARPGLFDQAGRLKLEAAKIILPVKRPPPSFLLVRTQFVVFVRLLLLCAARRRRRQEKVEEARVTSAQFTATLPGLEIEPTE